MGDQKDRHRKFWFFFSFLLSSNSLRIDYVYTELWLKLSTSDVIFSRV